MSPDRFTRRRAICIVAAAVAAPIAATGSRGQAAGYEWRGTAMGTDARILLSGVSPMDARVAANTAAAEIERLEYAFSLFRDDSEICKLNRNGVLVDPSGDLRRAVTLALRVAHQSGGLFDPTVQTLWEAYADWFIRQSDARLPPEAMVARARGAVNWRRIVLSDNKIQLGADQRMTLNGLGQGYVTDRVADLLRERGFRHVLVDLGEQRALGSRADGTPWPIGRGNGELIALANAALATSAGAGCVLGGGGAVHHLFDPRTGKSAAYWRRITVRHRSAAVADALSTALYAAPPAEIAGLLKRFHGAELWATSQDGREWVGSPDGGLHPMA